MSTKKNDKVYHPEPPTHRDIVELATQLVTAQIQANAQYESSVQVMSMIKRLSMDVAESIINVLRCESADGQNQLSTLPTTIRQHRLQPQTPKELNPMSHPDLDRLFQSAMRRAFVMLNAPFDSERVVYAEQIFAENELLTEGAIRKRLIDYKWPRLKSGPSVIKLMKDANNWFAAHIENMDLGDNRDNIIASTDPKIPIATRIESQATQLSRLLEQARESDNLRTETLTAYTRLKSALSELNATRNGADFTGAFRRHNAIERHNLISLIFGDMGPRGAETMSAKDDNTSQTRYYAWALFRYLRLYVNEDEDEDGRSLTERLRAPRSGLASNLIPDIAFIEPADYQFGDLHDKSQDRLDRLTEEEDN